MARVLFIAAGTEDRNARRYRKAVQRAFGTVTFYREQWAAAGEVLAEPVPTRTVALPDPPHTLCAFTRPWSAAREPCLWTPDLAALAGALRLAGCGGGIPVLEICRALTDQTRLPGHGRLLPGPAYHVLLAQDAVVSSVEHREALNAQAAAIATHAGTAWVVGSPAELAATPTAAGPGMLAVYRFPVSVAAEPGPAGHPVLLHDPVLGYLGAQVPACGRYHLDGKRVHARDRAGTVTFSLLSRRRPTLLDIVPAGAATLTVELCPQHGTQVLRGR